MEQQDEITYIGSNIKGSIITDYFKDTAGCYWFGNRAISEYGEIISMEEYIFGSEFLERKKKRLVSAKYQPGSQVT